MPARALPRKGGAVRSSASHTLISATSPSGRRRLTNRRDLIYPSSLAGRFTARAKARRSVAGSAGSAAGRTVWTTAITCSPPAHAMRLKSSFRCLLRCSEVARRSSANWRGRWRKCGAPGSSLKGRCRSATCSASAWPRTRSDGAATAKGLSTRVPTTQSVAHLRAGRALRRWGRTDDACRWRNSAPRLAATSRPAARQQRGGPALVVVDDCSTARGHAVKSQRAAARSRPQIHAGTPRRA